MSATSSSPVTSPSGICSGVARSPGSGTDVVGITIPGSGGVSSSDGESASSLLEGLVSALYLI